MKDIIRIAVAAFALMFLSAGATADEWPLKGGDYWSVGSITIKDGGSWKYANWLATEWRKNVEFAKSKGWIKDYMIIANVYPRAGEPDLYLIRVHESIPNAAEGRKRNEEYQEWAKKTNEKMVEESGNRAEYREQTSSSLLQQLHFSE